MKLTWKKSTNWENIVYTTDKFLKKKENKNNFIKKALFITLHYCLPLQRNSPSKVKVSGKINPSLFEAKWLRGRSLKRKGKAPSKVNVLKKINPFEKSNTFSPEKLNTPPSENKKNDKNKKDDEILCAAW